MHKPPRPVSPKPRAKLLAGCAGYALEPTSSAGEKRAYARLMGTVSAAQQAANRYAMLLERVAIQGEAYHLAYLRAEEDFSRRLTKGARNA